MPHLQFDGLELAVEESDAAGHIWHVELETAPVVVEYLPATHSEHTFGVVEYLPATHSEHTFGVGPSPCLYVPGKHREHGPPFAPVAPELHVHWVRALLSARDMEFSGQSSHPTAPKYFPAIHTEHPPFPASFLNLPVSHIVHMPLAALVKPALQMQSFFSSLAAGAFES